MNVRMVLCNKSKQWRCHSFHKILYGRVKFDNKLLVPDKYVKGSKARTYIVEDKLVQNDTMIELNTPRWKETACIEEAYYELDEQPTNMLQRNGPQELERATLVELISCN